MTPTDEQTHILDLSTKSRDNLQINALAGAGKSSTLRMIARASKTKPILYLVFNKRNAQEIEYSTKAKGDEALARMPNYVTVRTLNSLGHRIWAQTQPSGNLTLNTKKSNDLLKTIINEAPKGSQQVLWSVYWEVLEAVALAKAVGYIPNGAPKAEKSLCTWADLSGRLDAKPDSLVQDLVDEVLARSIRAAYAGTIDYNDQVYMPALFGGAYPKFPLVAVDEAQDLNPVNHAMLHKLVGQRLISVGDPQQSIYGFRGAVESGMQAIKEKFSSTEAPLSVSFRCPQMVVEAARWRVPDFKWIKPGGHVETLPRINLDAFSDTCTIICRNNAPLFALALRFLSNKRGVTISGSDVGPRIIGIMRKLGSDSMSQSQVLDKIAEWHDEKMQKESKSADDIAACMRVFAKLGSTLSSAIANAEHLFAQRGSIQMMTGHKAKGLEFPEVYFLDPWLCKEDEQDLNLRYVIQTRSADRLFEIDSRNIH